MESWNSLTEEDQLELAIKMSLEEEIAPEEDGDGDGVGRSVRFKEDEVWK